MPSIIPEYIGERSKFLRMMSCIFSFVWVIQHGTCRGCSIPGSINEKNGTGFKSPGCSLHFEKSLDLPSIRAGVPVFRRPLGRPRSINRSANLMDGGSPARPAEKWSRPIWTRPFKNVPLQITTLFAENRHPVLLTTPQTRLFSTIKSSAAIWKTKRLGWFSMRLRIATRYRFRSIWARVARTAGPFDRFKIRNWIPAASVTTPIAPPIASTSLTRWPLPMPPIDGLHDNCPIVSILCVIRSVFAPILAEAKAASAPAWPQPTTTTSNKSG